MCLPHHHHHPSHHPRSSLSCFNQHSNHHNTNMSSLDEADDDEHTRLLPSSPNTTTRYSHLDGVNLLERTNSIVYCIHGKETELCCEVISYKDGQNAGSTKFNLPHCHFSDEKSRRVDKQARKRLIIASVLCLFFMVGESIGGLLANSLAIASDAAHLLTDFASFMISLFSIWVASRPATKNMSFGWHRAEVIGALSSVLLIWVVTGILCYVAVERINTDFEIDSMIMLITASIGVVVNIIMGVSLTIGGVPHGHSHGGHYQGEDGHTHNPHTGKGNINVRAAFVHVLGDFFQSLGVLIAALVIHFYPQYKIIDPICTFLFSVIVLITTFTIIRDVLNVLMEGIPKGIDIQEVQKTLYNIQGVRKVHNLRIWSLSLDKAALSTHLTIEKEYEPRQILNVALREIKARYDIFELTIQIEEYQDDMNDCQGCQQK